MLFSVCFRWPRCISAKLHPTVQSWRALYNLRELQKYKMSESVLKATELLLYKNETPKCILPAVFRNIKDLRASFYTIDCAVDALFELCTPKQ